MSSSTPCFSTWSGIPLLAASLLRLGRRWLLLALPLLIMPVAAAQTQLPATPPIPATPEPQTVAGKIFQQALLNAVWGPPMMCDVRQSLSMYDRKVTGFGKYVRGGEGSGRIRLSLQMPAGDRMNSLFQVSDGELLHTHQSVGDESIRLRVDLAKVRERLVITSESLNDPLIAMHLSIGGQAEAIRKLCQQYAWEQVTDGRLGDQPVWWLTGKMSQNVVTLRGQTELDAKLMHDKQSGLLPLRSVVAIGRTDSDFPFWVYQVEQYRPAEPISPGETDGTELSLVTEWANPLVLTEVSDETFEATIDNEHFIDETRVYLPPVARVAAQPASSADLQLK